jgi:glycosyltransferase involved in cell wall biosynthesis
MSRIAVLIPVFNQPEDLLRTLASIDRQSADLEIFVVDDGSSRPISVDLSDYQYPVHVMVLAENQGCAAARNAGLRRILDGNFDYVALHDAGDTDIGNRMQTQAEYLDSHADLAAIGAATRYVDRAGELLYEYHPPQTSREIRARMPYNSAFANPATMFRLSALEQVGLYDTSFTVASDYELFFRLTKAFETANLPDLLIDKEDNPSGLSLSNRRRALKFRLRAQLRHINYLSIRSYLGILQSLIMWVLPYSAILAIKRRRGQAR